MSFQRVLVCDGCDRDKFTAADWAVSHVELRRLAKLRGWTVGVRPEDGGNDTRKRRDFCPECVDRLVDGAIADYAAERQAR